MPDSLTPLNTKQVLVSQVTCLTGQLPRTWGMAAPWVSKKTPMASQHLELLLPSAHSSEKLRARPAQGSTEAQLCQLWAAWQWGRVPVSSKKFHISWLTGIQDSLTPLCLPVSYFEHSPVFFSLAWFLPGYQEFTDSITLGACNSLTWNAVSKQTFVGNKEAKDCYSDHHVKPGWAPGIQWHKENSSLLSQPRLCHLSHTSKNPSTFCQGRLQVCALLWWPLASERSLLPTPGTKMPSEYWHKSLLFA